MMNQKKVGIMGGTFNPVHIGHLILAENAYEQFNLETILFMPLKIPPHKRHDHIASDEHRVNMLEYSILDNPHFELSRIELDRGNITRTCDTLTFLKNNNPDTDYYFILGADSIFQIESWKKPDIIFDSATIVVARRNCLTDDNLMSHISLLSKKYNAKIEILDTPNIDLSSKLIRERVLNASTINYYVQPDVRKYIDKHNLYR